MSSFGKGIRRLLTPAAMLLTVPVVTAPVAAQEQDQDHDARLRLLEATLEDLLRRDAEKDATIEHLRNQLEKLRAGNRTPTADAVHAYAHDEGGQGGTGRQTSGDVAHDHRRDGQGADLYGRDIGDGTLRFKGIDVHAALAAGYSSEGEEEIEALQGGGHDPRQNGFTLRTVDLSLYGGFDPYSDAETHIAVFLDTEGETQVELEEAFLVTRTRPLEIEAGQFFTEFGQFNPQHVHDWTWLDQPVVNSRLFGEDGLRAPGVRLGWYTPLPNTMVHLGMQNARGETMTSFLSSDEAFEERPIGGRAFLEREVDDFEEFVYLARFASQADLGPVRLVGGLSALYGPNATGPDGETYIYGADVAAEMPFSGGRFLRAQGEAMYRDYQADVDPGNGFDAQDLEDYGFFAQLLYGFHPEWAAGLRYEYVTGDGDSLGEFASRDDDPFRDDRQRVSPLLQWRFAPSAKVTLQYNYDDADHLDDPAHAVWIGLDWSFGTGGHGAGHSHAH